MASLTKQDRISMSKKIIEIPEENELVENVKAQILIERDQAIANDSVNAALQKPYNDIINSYQLEYNYIDGKKRTELTEARINNAAKGVNRNGFFLADPEFPTPSVPSGVWFSFPPMSFTYAIGKTNAETYLVEPLGEEPTLTEINSIISQIETYVIATRATGKNHENSCVGYNTSDFLTCINNGGVWTDDNLTVIGLLDDLKNAVQRWEDSLNAQKISIPLPDPIPSRELQNQTAYNQIDPLITMIDSWQGIQDFDTTTPLPSGESNFNSMGYTAFCTNPLYTTQSSCTINGHTWIHALQNSKLSPMSLQPIKDAITNRVIFLNTRKSQLDTHFGGINQNLTTGTINSTTGWYGERFLIVDARLNLLSGSANGKFGAEEALQIQDQIKNSNNTTLAAYNLFMVATKAVTPGLDSQYLTVEDSSIFSQGDTVYVVAENQEELSGSIEEIDGNRVKLTFVVPRKYTPNNKTRIYKLLNTII